MNKWLAWLCVPLFCLQIGWLLIVLQSTHKVWLLAYALSALGAAISARYALPARLHEPRIAVILFLWLINCALPVLGLLGLFVALYLAQRFPVPTVSQPFQELIAPEFTIQGDHIQVRFGVGGIRARLEDRDAPAETRLEALLAIKAMPQKLSGSVLRSLLDDPEEDLRLLAYGMLDSEEKNINAKINAALAEYASDAVLAARKLGLLYWELIYHKLAQGDVRHFALQEAARYVDQVLATTPDDAGMWVLRGKLHNASHQMDLAIDAFHCAAELGYPSSRLIPYLAEHAYLQHDFAKVSSLLKELGPLSLGDVMQPVATFWTRES